MDLFVMQRTQEILVVEDSLSDTKVVLWSLDKNRRGKSVVTVMDGSQAVAYLRARTDGQKPDLILLDLNMPKMDGWQVLTELKADASLRAIPVVVFTTSSDPADVARCYALGANSFITKPFELDAFKRAIERIEDYWLGLSVPAL